MTKHEQNAQISSLISLLMTAAALIYMFVMGKYLDGDPAQVGWLMMAPPLALLAGAMYFLINPAKVEW